MTIRSYTRGSLAYLLAQSRHPAARPASHEGLDALRARMGATDLRHNGAPALVAARRAAETTTPARIPLRGMKAAKSHVRRNPAAASQRQSTDTRRRART